MTTGRDILRHAVRARSSSMAALAKEAGVSTNGLTP